MIQCTNETLSQQAKRCSMLVLNFKCMLSTQYTITTITSLVITSGLSNTVKRGEIITAAIAARIAETVLFVKLSR